MKFLSVRWLKWIFVSMITISIPLGATVEAANISVKLVNYVGNVGSLTFKTTGTYHINSSDNERISGGTDFEVATNIAKNGWTKADAVVVVNATAFADALSAAPYAYKLDAPILLSNKDTLSDETVSAINSLQPNKVVIIGGEGTISANVYTELSTLVSNVTRIDGHDRFEVASNVAKEVGDTSKVILANGLNFADALAIAPYAAKNGYPILLTKPNELPKVTKESMGTKSVLVVGGEASVSKAVYDLLPTPQRIGGSNRFAVSANIVTTLYPSVQKAFLATGLNFVDALVGSVLAAKQNSPMLLTTETKLSSEVADVIGARNISEFTIIGGTDSISNTVVSSLPNEMLLSPDATYTVKVEQGKLALYKDGKKADNFGTTFDVKPNSYDPKSKITLNKNTYLGTMNFTVEGGKYVRPTNVSIPFEDYLKGVVPREMPASWSLESLKAQAVSARTFSIDEATAGKAVLDSQSYQVYGGYNWSESSNQAVDGTKNKVLLDKNGKLVQTFFSSSNGGYIEASINVWTGGTPIDYLMAKEDPYDPQTPWELTLAKVQIDDTLLDLTNPASWWTATTEKNKDIMKSVKTWLVSSKPAIPEFQNKDIRIVSIPSIVMNPELTTGMRAINGTLKIEYYAKDTKTNQYVMETGMLKKQTFTKLLKATEMRSMFGTMIFRSTLVDNVIDLGTDIVITGRGFGHGIGMSQSGAYGMAKQGKNYEEILQFYYPTTSLVDYK